MEIVKNEGRLIAPPITDSMSFEELGVYELEKKIIARHFQGLRPRQIFILDGDAVNCAAGTYLKLDKKLLENKLRLKQVITHCLIHYELEDKGLADGHTPLFLKREASLRLAGLSERIHCYSTDSRLRPVRSGNSISIKDVKDQMDEVFRKYHRLPCPKNPNSHVLQRDDKMAELHAFWTLFWDAVYRKEKTVTPQGWEWALSEGQNPNESKEEAI
jgi:hypothetical protein